MRTWTSLIEELRAPAPELALVTDPTPAEAANGWTEDTLSAYVAERRAAEDARIDPRARRKPRPQSANSTLARSRYVREPQWTVGRPRWGPGRN